MKSEKQQLLERVLLMMKYDTKNTLSENLKRDKKIIKESVDSLYNLSVNIDNLFKSLKVGSQYEITSGNNLISKDILKQDIEKFSCEVQKTSVNDLIALFNKKVDFQGANPTAEEFYGSDKSTNYTITIWLLESYLFAALKYRINNKSLTNQNEHPWGWIIRVPTGTETETKYEKEWVEGSLEGGYFRTIPYQVVTTKRERLGNFNDQRYQEYIKKLQDNKSQPSGPELQAIPSSDWKSKLKYIFNLDVEIDVYSLCNVSKPKQVKEEPKKPIGCPFSTVEEENEFRDWVNKTYPEIASTLKLNLAAPKNQICNDYLKKALDYMVERKDWKQYKHPGI